MRDEGDYECQISTQPVRSLFYSLKVVGKHIPLSICIRCSNHFRICLLPTFSAARSHLGWSGDIRGKGKHDQHHMLDQLQFGTAGFHFLVPP